MQLTSDAINEIAAALAKAQSEMSIPKKDKQNPHFKNKYASLGSILTSCKDALNKNGLSISQQFIEENGKDILVSTLLHSSGQWIRSCMPIRIDAKATAQQFGSATTYAKRYSLTALLCVDADEDDDGVIASAAPQAAPVQKEKELLSQDMVDQLTSKLLPEDLAATKSFCKRSFGSEDLRLLPLQTYQIALAKAIRKSQEDDHAA